jgi:magnesium transporter
MDPSAVASQENQLDIAEARNAVESMLESGQIEEVDRLLDSMDPANRLIVLSRLDRDLRQGLLQGLSTERAADYLHDIPEVQALRLLEKMPPEQAADILEEMPKDEQADLVGELTSRVQQSILAEMDDDDAAEVRELIEYDDEEAGGMMTVEFVSVAVNLTAADVTSILQKNSEIYSDYDVQYIYVVDRPEKGRLLGVLRLRDLVLSPPDTGIERLMIKDPVSVDAHTSLRDLHQLFMDHSYLGVPVVNPSQELIGVLNRGDVEEAMAERYADDYRKSLGIVDEELRTMPLGQRSRRRLAWLSINIFLNIIAASVIAVYQETLAQVIALAVFLPIISDMSGCSGNQAVAVSMRELSLGLVKPTEVLRVWLKEAGVGLINGFSLGILIALVAFFWKGNPWLGIVVGAAMMINTLIAVSLGGTLPLVMRMLKLDPALASGPILTTVTDMCGFFLVLSLAAMWLEKLL